MPLVAKLAPPQVLSGEWPVFNRYLYVSFKQNLGEQLRASWPACSFAVVCEAGQYRDPSQTVDCTECALNYYQSNRGETNCTYCGDGKVTMTKATVDPTDCVGKYADSLLYLMSSQLNTRVIEVKPAVLTVVLARLPWQQQLLTLMTVLVIHK